MSSRDQQWWYSQSGEYVLGTLGPEDVKFFEKVMLYDEDIRQLVVDWRERLQPLADGLDSIEPPERVWHGIVDQLEAQPSQSHSAIDSSAPDSRILEEHSAPRSVGDYQKGFGRGADLWRSLAGLATAACLLMGIALWAGLFHKPISDLDAYNTLAVFVDQNREPLWLLDADTRKGSLRVTTMTPPKPEPNKAYQLWLVLPDDAGVVSIGLLPISIDQRITLTMDELPIEASAYAISLEPDGGSTLEGPSGPVLYQADIRLIRL